MLEFLLNPNWIRILYVQLFSSFFLAVLTLLDLKREKAFYKEAYPRGVSFRTHFIMRLILPELFLADEYFKHFDPFVKPVYRKYFKKND